MTAIGPIRIGRWHADCRSCRDAGFPADRVIGVLGWLTLRARRMAWKAGLHAPFRKAEELLEELSGWSIDAETLRRHRHAEAAQAAQGRAERVGLPAAFAAATGDAELHIDAGKVNTREGWRDVKVAVFAVRPRGPAAAAEDYEQRELPPPSVRSVIAAVEEVGLFEPRCRAEADRLGLTDPTRRSVLGDGAEWIWNLATRSFAGASQVLDVYHAVEHLATAGRVAFGEAPGFADWLTAARRRLVGDGYCGVCTTFAQPLPDPIAERLAAAAGPALNYFAGHRDRLGYAVRLRRGQAIGSGLVEGTIKERVNLRLKRTGARWRAERVGSFVELLALADTAEWDEYWKSLAA